MPNEPTPTDAPPLPTTADPAQLAEELARERAEVERLRNLLLTRDAELGVASGRLLELETLARFALGPIHRLRALSPEFLWRFLGRFRKPRS